MCGVVRTFGVVVILRMSVRRLTRLTMMLRTAVCCVSVSMSQCVRMVGFCVMLKCVGSQADQADSQADQAGHDAETRLRGRRRGMVGQADSQADQADKR